MAGETPVPLGQFLLQVDTRLTDNEAAIFESIQKILLSNLSTRYFFQLSGRMSLRRAPTALTLMAAKRLHPTYTQGNKNLGKIVSSIYQVEMGTLVQTI